MEMVTRTILAVGLLLLLCSFNVWVLRSLYFVFRGGDLVVAPFQIIGDKNVAGEVGDGLPQLLLNRLSTLERDLDNAQRALIASGRRAVSASAKSPTVSEGPPSASAPSIGLPRFFDSQRIAGLEARLLEPIDINLKVGGVEVGRFIPAVQRWLVKDKILTFSLLYQGDQVIVSGDLEAFGGTGGRRVWLKLPRSDIGRIVDKLALAILHRKVLAQSRSTIPGAPQSELDVIDEDDFETLVDTVISAADLNRRIETFGVPQSAEFAKLLRGVEALTIKMPQWDALNHLAATIAEGAGDRAKALVFYRKLKASPHRAIAQAEWLAIKLAALRDVDAVAVDDVRRQIENDVAFATDFLNELFGMKLSAPKVQILAKDYRNAYWDGQRLHLPPQAQHIPDLTYHEAAWPFIQSVWRFENLGESGALANSYADVLSALIRQARLGETANTADWLVAPGAVAWLKGEDVATSPNRAALRSFKQPGTAYNDPMLGKDPQASTYAERYVGDADNGGIHLNSGIPNKAFYETAMRIGSDKASQIWTAALKRLQPASDFREAAKTMQSAATTLFGPDSPERAAVGDAWAAVGLKLTAPGGGDASN